MTDLILPKGHKVINQKYYETIKHKIDNNEGFGYLFKGVVGSGKSELMKIVSSWFPKPKPRVHDIVNVYESYLYIIGSNFTDKVVALDNLIKTFTEQTVFLDDLGYEVEIYGNSYKFTMTCLNTLYNSFKAGKTKNIIISTNNNASLIRKHYGDRVYDRMLEMLEIVNFPNRSFREDKVKTINL